MLWNYWSFFPRKEGGKAFFKLLKTIKTVCLISALLLARQKHKPYYSEPSSVQGFQCYIKPQPSTNVRMGWKHCTHWQLILQHTELELKDNLLYNLEGLYQPSLAYSSCLYAWSMAWFTWYIENEGKMYLFLAKASTYVIYNHSIPGLDVLANTGWF